MNNEQRKTDGAVYFWGGVYSQWYSSENQIEENGIFFNSAEKYMMYHKALLFSDTEIAKEILTLNNAKKIKALGRKIKNFDEEVWNNNKEDIVTQGSFLKFSQNMDLLDIMLKDKELKLVEASPLDKIWGIGLHYDDVDVEDESKWQGQNLLGKCLMQARTYIKN